MKKRIIFYLCDGISAFFLRTFNDKIRQLTYLDRLFSRGKTYHFMYGYDNTAACFFRIFSGKEFIENPYTMPYDYKKFREVNALLSALNPKKSLYYSNNFVVNRSLLTSGFTDVIHEHFNYDFSVSKFWNATSQRVHDFVFIHDMYTHDQRGEYAKGKWLMTTDEYLSYIEEHGHLLKKNLDVIGFDPAHDILFLFSDHGMTVDSTQIPKGSGVFDAERLRYWDMGSNEKKSRVFLSVISDGIAPSKELRPQTLFRGMHDTLNQYFGVTYESLLSRQFDTIGDCILPSFGIAPPTWTKLLSFLLHKEKVHQFFHIVSTKNHVVKHVIQPTLHKSVAYTVDHDFSSNNPQRFVADEKFCRYIKRYERNRIMIPTALINYYKMRQMAHSYKTEREYTIKHFFSHGGR